MKNLRISLLVISALLGIGSMILVAWANWPPAMTSREVSLHLIAPATWDQASGQQVKALTYEQKLTTPSSLKKGQTAYYQLLVDQLPASVSVAGKRHTLRIRCELVLPGFINEQAGMLTQSVVEGKALRFTWEIRAIEAQSAQGVLRSYVDYVSPAGEIESQLLSVTDLQLVSHSLLGISTRDATSLAVALLLLAGLAGGLGLTRQVRGTE
jgi:hypothetical protein